MTGAVMRTMVRNLLQIQRTSRSHPIHRWSMRKVVKRLLFIRLDAFNALEDNQLDGFASELNPSLEEKIDTHLHNPFGIDHAALYLFTKGKIMDTFEVLASVHEDGPYFGENTSIL